jgi:hypothetical protein
MTDAVNTIISQMVDVARPGQRDIDVDTKHELDRLTDQLLDTDTTAIDEYHRYLAVKQRKLDLSAAHDQLIAAYRGRRILVTGGTGCIGSMLIRQLLRYEPSEIYCIYSNSNDFDAVPGVRYLDVDIQDEVATRRAVRAVRPDVLFHCAAQRSPWLAEREVARTVRSNVLGTRNVLRGARDIDLRNFVHASTGKAMRYHTGDVYAASKKIGEWLVHEYAAEGRTASAARFTHVVDNAVLLDKLSTAETDGGGVMRVHGADIAFYAQSAIESAQLLLLAGVNAGPGLRLLAIRELGAPPRLLRVVLGQMQASSHGHPAIYLSGCDEGYERGNPPGLYDPRTANEVSPLINAVEARTAMALPSAPEVDQFRCGHGESSRVDAVVDALAARCRQGDPSVIAEQLSAAVGVQAESAFTVCPEDLFVRLDGMARTAGVPLPTRRRPGRRQSSGYVPASYVA